MERLRPTRGCAYKLRGYKDTLKRSGYFKWRGTWPDSLGKCLSATCVALLLALNGESLGHTAQEDVHDHPTCVALFLDLNGESLGHTTQEDVNHPTCVALLFDLYGESLGHTAQEDVYHPSLVGIKLGQLLLFTSL